MEIYWINFLSSLLCVLFIVFMGSPDTLLSERLIYGESYSSFSCLLVDCESAFKLSAGQKKIPHFLSYWPLERKKYCFCVLDFTAGDAYV